MLRRIVAPTLWALRAYRGTAFFFSAVAATGLAALLPVASLVAPPGTAAATRLGLAAWRGADLGMPWSALASSPTATQRAALEILFRLLLGGGAPIAGAPGAPSRRARRRRTEPHWRSCFDCCSGSPRAFSPSPP